MRRAASATIITGASRVTARTLAQGSRGQETTTYSLLALLASNGVEILRQGAVTLDAPGAIEALRFLRSFLDEDLMPPEVVNYEYDRPVRMLAAGSQHLLVAVGVGTVPALCEHRLATSP